VNKNGLGIDRDAFHPETIPHGQIVVIGDRQFRILHQLLLPQQFFGNGGFDFS
jgi:hypothetical protein